MRSERLHRSGRDQREDVDEHTAGMTMIVGDDALPTSVRVGVARVEDGDSVTSVCLGNSRWGVGIDRPQLPSVAQLTAAPTSTHRILSHPAAACPLSAAKSAHQLTSHVCWLASCSTKCVLIYGFLKYWLFKSLFPFLLFFAWLWFSLIIIEIMYKTKLVTRGGSFVVVSMQRTSCWGRLTSSWIWSLTWGHRDLLGSAE